MGKTLEIKTRRVCSFSGVTLKEACPASMESFYIPGISSEVPCSYHEFSKRENQTTIRIVYPENLIPFLSPFMKNNNHKHHFKINFPIHGGEYLLPNSKSSSFSTMDLNVIASSPFVELFWFLDGEMIAKTKSDFNLQWEMTPGKHTLVVSDAFGKSIKFNFLLQEWILVFNPRY